MDVLDVNLRNEAFVGNFLRRIKFPSDPPMLDINRDNEIIVPDGGTTLRDKDVLVWVGTRNY